MFKNKILIIIVVLLCFSAVSVVNAEETVLRYWTFSDFGTGDLLALQQVFIDEFLKDHPGYRVEVSAMGDDELLSSLTTAAMSGTMPDLFVNTTRNGALFVSIDAMINIYDLWMAKPEEYRANFDPATVAVMTPEDNTMWALPYTGFSQFMYRNLDVLEAAGIDPNEEISDMEVWADHMKKISEAGFYGTYSYHTDWWNFLSIYSSFAEKSDWGIDFSQNISLLNPEKLVKTVEFLKKIAPYSTQLKRGEQGAIDLFTTNKLAYYPDGPWADIAFRKVEGLNYDFALIPGGTSSQHGGVGGLEMLCVGNTDNWEVAWELASYLVDTPQMARWAEIDARYLGNMTAMKTAADRGDKMLAITEKATPYIIYNQTPFFEKAYPGNYYAPLLEYLDMAMNDEVDLLDGAIEARDLMTESIKEEYE